MESLKSDYEKTRFIVEHHVLEHTGNELLELIKDAELMEEKRRSKQTQVRIVSSVLLRTGFMVPALMIENWINVLQAF